MSKTDLDPQRQEAKVYCLYRKLERPPLRIKMALYVLFLYMIYVILSSFLLNFFFNINLFFDIVIPIIVSIPFIGNRFLIYCIKIYQHYASEKIRRRCICKPSCSEYAIAVLKKYRLIKACYKIYIRLTRTCRGRKFIIDYP